MREISEKPICKKCLGLKTSKAGITKGKQRFYCRECMVVFIENPTRPNGKRKYEIKTDILPTKRRLILELHVIAQSLGKTPTTKDIARFSKKITRVA